MGEKQRIEKGYAKTLHINGTATSPVVGGQVSVTGAGTVTVPLKAISAVVATIGAADVAGAETVTATFSGNVITLSVWTSAFAASTTPTVVSWIAVGS